jgi:hypothetical protein
VPQPHLNLTVLPNQECVSLNALFAQIDTDGPPWWTLSEQIAVIIGAFCDRTVLVPWRFIGAPFRVTKGAAHSYYKRATENRMTGMAGRPSTLTEEE